MSLSEPRVKPAWDATGIHGVHRAREWDAVVLVDAPDVNGERATFVALANGDLVLEEGGDHLSTLANALERELTPPYRADAVRREETLWAVAGRKVELLELPGVTGDEIELSMHDGARSLLVDGERSVGSIPPLERPEQVVRAKRVDGEIWEVDSAPL
jgi:hypothetical protein